MAEEQEKNVTPEENKSEGETAQSNPLDSEYQMIQDMLLEIKKEEEEAKKKQSDLLKKEEMKKVAKEILKKQQEDATKAKEDLEDNKSKIEELESELEKLKSESKGSKIEYQNNNPLEQQGEHKTTMKDVEDFAKKANSYKHYRNNVMNNEFNENTEATLNQVASILGIRR